MNAARAFHAKQRYRRFPWGKSVMFLTTYVQGGTGGPVNNDMLVLVVQGFTNDGKYAVNGRFEISHLMLPELDWKAEYAGKRMNFSIDDETDKAKRWLDEQPDDSFKPSFQQYEEFLNALEILSSQP